MNEIHALTKKKAKKKKRKKKSQRASSLSFHHVRIQDVHSLQPGRVLSPEPDHVPAP